MKRRPGVERLAPLISEPFQGRRSFEVAAGPQFDHHVDILGRARTNETCKLGMGMNHESSDQHPAVCG